MEMEIKVMGRGKGEEKLQRQKLLESIFANWAQGGKQAKNQVGPVQCKQAVRKQCKRGREYRYVMIIVVNLAFPIHFDFDQSITVEIYRKVE